MIHEKKIPPSLSQTFTADHHNVFTVILSLSDGRTGISRVPSNKMLFPTSLPDKVPLASHQNFLFTSALLPSSLSFGFKGLRSVLESFTKNCRTIWILV
jgi:hypothetical protein